MDLRVHKITRNLHAVDIAEAQDIATSNPWIVFERYAAFDGPCVRVAGQFVSHDAAVKYLDEFLERV